MNQLDSQSVFFMSKDEPGALAAWPLHSPAVTAYGGWSWVNLTTVSMSGGVNRVDVTFVRQMTDDEIRFIRGRYMVWGMKLPTATWALVQGRPGGSDLVAYMHHSDSSRSVGV